LCLIVGLDKVSPFEAIKEACSDKNLKSFLKLNIEAFFSFIDILLEQFVASKIKI